MDVERKRNMTYVIKREVTDKVDEFLTKEEARQFKHDFSQYLKAYPFLNEPVAFDMLREALLIKIQIQRLHKKVFGKAADPSELLQNGKQLDALQRTMALYFTRLGITFTSRQRQKEHKKVRTALEEQEDEKAE
jgi:hypothetical protein